MAKAESGLRQRIKAALEADGWCVLTVHGSAYNPHIPDLMVVVAGLEVKMPNGVLRPGQRNKIRKLRAQGIPAGVVRSVDEARRGMALVKQGVCPVTQDTEAPIDMSFLNNLLAGATAAPEAPSAPPSAPPSDGPTLTELMGMQGEFKEFTPVPAADPESTPETNESTLSAEPKFLVDTYQSVAQPPESVLEQARDLAGKYQEGLVSPEHAVQDAGFTIGGNLNPRTQYQAVPATGLGVLEQIIGYLAHIDQMLTALVEGYSQGAVQPQQPTETVKRTRRGRPPKTETPEEE